MKKIYQYSALIVLAIIQFSCKNNILTGGNESSTGATFFDYVPFFLMVLSSITAVVGIFKYDKKVTNNLRALALIAIGVIVFAFSLVWYLG